MQEAKKLKRSKHPVSHREAIGAGVAESTPLDKAICEIEGREGTSRAEMGGDVASPPFPDRESRTQSRMTTRQSSFLKRLCLETGADFDDSLTKSRASRRIDELLKMRRTLQSPGAPA